MSGNRTRPLKHKYQGLVLDEFQQEALWHIQNETSLLLSAPTGTGKTLVADYLIDQCLKENQRLVYTAPIKALVNQKYSDFSRRFGRQVGVTTGDITVNANAPLVVMTTEIFRNMLLRQDSRVLDLQWVIFDELHYLNHRERGTVWEESILLKPEWIRLLGLSATVPNIDEIAAWISNIHGEAVSVVKHKERAVPLRHLYFNQACQGISRDRLMQSLAETVLKNDDAYDFKGGNLTTEDIQLPKNYRYKESTRFVDLVRYVSRQGLFPALYFCFSRKGCEDKARATANRNDYLKPREKRAVAVNVRKRLTELSLSQDEIPNLEHYMHQWEKGIGVHHAGMLPITKQLAETLLAQGLVRILFTTETFSVGVNMPVRTVCFDSLIKYDGSRYRYLTHQEYFQMAGRAGRRGKDRMGTVLSLVDFATLTKKPIPEWNEQALEPIQSKFELSYNMVLNLCSQFSETELLAMFEKTLLGYQNPQQYTAIVEDYRHRRDTLYKLEFLDEDGLTARGLIGQGLYVQELLLTEVVFNGALRSLKPKQLAGMAASLAADVRLRLPPTPPEKWLGDIRVVGEQLARQGGLEVEKVFSINPAASHPVYLWADGADIGDLLKETGAAPGDFVQLCRRTIDILRQLHSVSENPLRTKLEQAIHKVDRGVVQVRF